MNHQDGRVSRGRLAPPLSYADDQLALAYRRVGAAVRSSTWVRDTEYDLVFAAHPDLGELDALRAFWYPEEAA